MDRFSIRKATLNDLDTIVNFNAALAKETENIRLDQRRLRQGVRKILEDSTRGFYLLAESNRQSVGQLMITHEWSDWRNGFFWWIQSVYVAPAYRNKGVFRFLFDHSMKLAKRQSNICGVRLYVDQHNVPAKKVYKNLGMVKTDYEIFEIDFILTR